MWRGKNPVSSAKAVALTEIKGEKRARAIELFLLSVTLISTSAFLIMFTSHYLSTGYATYLNSQAGSITEVTLERTFPTTFWNGVYGLALRVPGFTQQLSTNVSNEIDRLDVFFDCLHPNPQGGQNEIYASNYSTIDFTTLQPATVADIDSFMGCSGREDCASGTFTRSMNIMLGTTNISGIPSSYTYKYDGDNEVFDIGILKDGDEKLVFVSHVSDIQKGYSEEVTVNFQVLLPTPEGAWMEYFFFTDPYEDCPAGGGIGETLDADVWGWVTNSSGAPLENVTIVFAGMVQNTSSTGFYNLSATVTEGNYTVYAYKTGYDDAFGFVNLTFNETTAERNITMQKATPGYNTSIIPHVHGYIKDTSGIPIFQATVALGGSSTQTDLFGYYSMYPAISPENHTFVAYAENYHTNYTTVVFTNETTDVEVNMTLAEIVSTEDTFPYETGPYTKQLISNIQEEAIRDGEDYWVSTKEINVEVRQNTFIEDVIGIYNFGSSMSLSFLLNPELTDVVVLDQSALTVPSNSFGELGLTIFGTEPLGTYRGNITISGDLVQKIPVTVKIVERRMPIETLLIRVDLFQDEVQKGRDLKYKLTLQNLLSDQGYMVELTARVRDINGSTVYVTKKTEEEIASTLTLLDSIEIPKEIANGEYYLDIDAKYLNLVSRVKVPFKVSQPLYLYSFFGIPLWTYLLFISFLSFIMLNLFLYKRHLEKNKRYRVAVDYSTLPGPGERNVRMGHIAETKKDAYLELDKLTVHTIVAGATGMGKSISAQVIIEEALMKNVCVIVFDPTAQWSGMLRKCTDKKMLSFYPKFGMKPTEARGFPGNIRAVKDARQIIDINKHFEPGHIQIFTLNKLKPKDMDIFVANVIRQIFKSDPKESPELKILLVFDEVHRLLPRFGGSGEGFLQIERGCREFRKWGLGQILISQVMNDFVGEIKANINTEVQARTVEEGDLERIKSRYGESFLKSLVKSEVGVSMFQNAEYNRGLPYFINFRPILHNTRRLSDEELDKYNQYNDQVDDLEFQIEQLEEEKIDVFDLKMELKLVKGKIMVGNFSVVDIYLEGLVPRVAKQWEKLGKKPKKKQIELASVEDIKKSIEEAKSERKKEEEKEAIEKKATASKVEKENIDEKQFSALTFDNGAMVSSLKELKELLPDLDDEIFKTHVNEQKNDIATWFKQISPTFSAKIKTVLEKPALIKEINDFKLEEKTPAVPVAKTPVKPSPTKATATSAKKPVTVTAKKQELLPSPPKPVALPKPVVKPIAPVEKSSIPTPSKVAKPVVPVAKPTPPQKQEAKPSLTAPPLPRPAPKPSTPLPPKALAQPATPKPDQKPIITEPKKSEERIKEKEKNEEGI